MKLTAVVVASAAIAVFVPASRAQTALNQAPSRVIGQEQLQIKTLNPNLIVGRELYIPEGVAVDSSSSPNALYVADTGNDRVLAWRDASSFANGAPADMVLGQVDLSTAFQQGPSVANRSRYLTYPVGITVDAQGNVYVYDAGNNRVVRYPKPFSQGGGLPDFVIGQPGWDTNAANQGGISAHSLSSFANGALNNGQVAMAPDGSLWVGDPGNNRVLHFSKSALDSGKNGPDADTVIGQPNFISNTAAPNTSDGRLNRTQLNGPAGIGLDSKGRLFVGDALSRVLVFVPANGALQNGQAASRIMGIYLTSTPSSQPIVNEYVIATPAGITVAGDSPIISDSALNRVLVFPPVDTWAPENPQVQISPTASRVIGQSGMAGSQVNQGQPQPNAATLAHPSSTAVAGTDLLVVDTGNNRLLAFPNLGTGTNPQATRLLGQDGFDLNGPNLLEGRELATFVNSQTIDGAGIAFDRYSDTPHLYIADTYNNRILGFADARKVKTGDKADLVIGQVDLLRALVNSPGNDASLPNQLGLYHPAGLAVDASGNLWVADSGNGRVLRYPAPFANPPAAGQQLAANLVLGQTSFTTNVTDPTARTMSHPFGLGLTSDGGIAVSDVAFNRVLYFRKPASGDFQVGQAADLVIGQPDFVTGSQTTGPARFRAPRHIAIDTDDRLYVADYGNNRLVMFDRINSPNLANDPSPALAITGIGSPYSVSVNHQNGEIWVGDPNQQVANRFPNYNQLGVNPTPNYQVSTYGSIALAQDPYGNLYSADIANRVGIYYNGIAPANAASGNDVYPLAPGMIASLYPASPNQNFGSSTASAASLPLPFELADTQVFVNETASPLLYVSPTQINFIVPSNAPQSSTAQYLVVRKSTGQVVGAGTISMQASAPGLFSVNQAGTGQLAAINQDGSTNDSTHPIPRGQVIQLFGTGAGVIPNGPPDGSAPSGPVSTDGRPNVLVGFEFVDQAAIEYSGLAPCCAGLWQINVRIPTTVVPANNVNIVVQFKSAFSNIGKSGNKIVTTIAVSQ